jgi:phospholipid transport system substrate-binding protein
VRGRYDKLAPVIRSTFDLPAMTRIAVGPEWTAIPPDQQTALLDNFARMTIATYANRFDGWSGQSFEVDAEVLPRNNGRIVRTKLVRPKEEPVTLNYLMRGAGDSWKVVDIYLSGTISELATQRSEFGAILKAGGPAALIESLRQQIDKLMKKPDRRPSHHCAGRPGRPDRRATRPGRAPRESGRHGAAARGCGTARSSRARVP